MTKRKTSIALSPREIERFQQAADDRGLSFSKFMAQSATNILDSSDATKDMRAFAADLRADLSKVLERLLESDALQAQERTRFLDEQRQVLSNFLADLKESQREAIKEAFMFGQKNPAAPQPRVPTDHDLGIHRPPTTRS